MYDGARGALSATGAAGVWEKKSEDSTVVFKSHHQAPTKVPT